MKSRWIAATLLTLIPAVAFALSDAVTELKGEQVAEWGDFRLVEIQQQTKTVSYAELTSTDPGGIGRLSYYHGTALRVERKSDGKRAYVIMRGTDGKWLFENRLNVKKALGLFEQPGVVLGLESVATE